MPQSTFYLRGDVWSKSELVMQSLRLDVHYDLEP